MSSEIGDEGVLTHVLRPVAHESAVEVGASPHRYLGGNRLMQFRSGNGSPKPVTGSDRPVVALAREAEV